MRLRWMCSLMIGLSALALGGCGFQLRQPAVVPMAYQQLYVQLPDSEGGQQLAAPLLRQLQIVGVDAERTPAAPTSRQRLWVTSVQPSRFLLNGQLTEIQLSLQVRFQIEDAQGQPLTSERTLWGRRTYQYDTATVNTENQQEAQLWLELYDDLAGQLSRQIQLGRLPAAAKLP